MPMTFTEPFLTYARLEMNPDFKDNGQGMRADLHFHLNLSKSENERSAIATLRLQINQKFDEREDNAPFWLEVEYSARFSWDENLTKEDIDKMLQINAAAILIGYIRPMVSMLTSSSPMPTYTLPFVNVNDLFKDGVGQGNN